MPPSHESTPPSNPETLGTEIATFLQQFQHKSYPYVHPRAISFHSDQDRANWINYMPDATSRDPFSSFGIPISNQDRKTRIGLFCTPNGPLTGNQWEHRPWHAYAIAIIPGRTKRIIIWDCDPVKGVTAQKRWKHILWGKQRSFIEYLRTKRRMRGAEIWYNTDTSHSGKDLCLQLSLQKVREWASLGDMSYQGTSDPRFKDCIKLKL